ncbi:unnamed protein product [Ostreobium quekettii]|uniref:Uncharacterized protein n=1 Tax=Ostreobium quekettii TaxID=121088 RepID=A0A8S1IKL7_9CHLO|nr:unnamed protein product [Ostreobium quekettii]|eukprot:evm.model.scf_601.3 EVM.evm.TU.scf_601.3   scf_601:22178-22861(+)
MDGYFMFGNKLVCQVLKHQELHKRMFFKWRKKMHNRRRGHTKRAQEAHNRERSEDEQAAQVKKLIAKDAHRQKRILEMGIDYHYSGFKDVAAPPGKKRRLQGDGGASVPSAGAKRDDAMITNDECLDLSDLELEEDGCQMDEASDLENDCEAMAGAVPITISKGKSHSSEGGVPHAKAVRVGKKKGSKPPGKGEKRNDMPQRHASHERGGDLGTKGMASKKKKKMGR